MTAAKVELGRHLFYDRRMSGNQTQACASCHIQKFAFTDGRPRAVGSTGEVHPRGSMSLVNIAWANTLTWGNPNLKRLEEQAKVPMFGTSPVELGLEPGAVAFLSMAAGNQRYQRLFREAFPKEANPFKLENVVRAIACFERSIISVRSAWDVDWTSIRRLTSDFGESRMSEESQRGEVLFFSTSVGCFQCHGGDNFDAPTPVAGVPRSRFHNNGVRVDQPGLAEFSKRRADVGKFKAPTMRNIELTAPYMHDGSIATLEEVIEHYASGGNHNANQSSLVRKLALSERDRADLVAFLRSLTDDEVTRDPRFSDPWPSELDQATAKAR